MNRRELAKDGSEVRWHEYRDGSIDYCKDIPVVPPGWDFLDDPEEDGYNG